MTSSAGPLSRKLACHPGTPTRVACAIEVRVEGAANGILALSFALQGDLASLRIPAERPRRRGNELWRHTCFEAFLLAGAGPGYREYNFSPSGEWAAYGFCNYRQAIGPEDISAPSIRVQRGAQCLVLEAKISLEPPPSPGPLRLGLSAVVEESDGTLSYWALRHPPGKPDFHHVDAFALRLDGARMRNPDDLIARVAP